MAALENANVRLVAELYNTAVLQVTGGSSGCEALCAVINLQSPEIPPTCWGYADFGNNTCTLYISGTAADTFSY